MRRYGSGLVAQPLRTILRPECDSGLLGTMPGFLAGTELTGYGLKAMVLRPENPARGLDLHIGIVMVFDPETGAPLALMDAGAVTAVRTAAVSAVATDALARPEAGDLAVLGSGVQARSHTRAVFLCEPDNPTGTAVGTTELERFLERVPGDVLVVLDEAYFEFHHSPNAPDGVTLHYDRPNLLALRTFSKAYGLAGLRVGYGVAQPAIAEALRKCAVPCGVSRIAEEAALTALRVGSELFERVERIVAERERTREALLGLDWEVLPSETNFLWLPAGEASEPVAAEWERRGLLVRAFPGSGLRVTVGSPEVNDLLITAAKETAPPAP